VDDPSLGDSPVNIMKHALQLCLGAGVYACWRVFRPAHLASIREQLFASHQLSLLERHALAFTHFITRMDTRSASSCWAGRAGSRFHADGDHRLTLEVVSADTFYRRPMLEEFARRAAQTLRPGASIVEIGCGAGGNLLYLRQQLAGSGFRFIGYDINSEVIASNRQHASADLSFEVRDCFSDAITVPGDLGLICCAVLMYAQEPEIRQLFQAIARARQGRILLGISEPALDPEAPRALPHSSMALLHGYRRILRELGFRQVCEAFRQEGNKPSRIYHAVFEMPR
jgi:SAM-dependent methyltransferase